MTGISMWTHSDGVEMGDAAGGQVVYPWPDAIPQARTVLFGARTRGLLPEEPLAALKAEVERLRDEANNREASQTQLGAAYQWSGRAVAYETVLDLIDKQREGQ